ncbi:MAG: tRNA preQ1(34) S-adenosylmethionine ribosyltransferase-isomerase QueA, partial [Gammaproteobacteria bacterium]
MQLADFDFELPPDRIAQSPAAERDAARLLVVGRDELTHRRFREIGAELRPGDLLVLNDTRVVPARVFAEKDSGGRAELLLERVLSETVARCQVRVSKPLKPGRLLRAGHVTLEVLGRDGQFYDLRFPGPVYDVLATIGEVPLPPYIERAAGAADVGRYQTVYAAVPGAVAAPTAGLHFTDALLAQLVDAGIEMARVTLHVGAGTFQPVRVDNIAAHRMHSERYAVPAHTVAAIQRCRQRGGRVVAVGTTVVRTLEAAARAHDAVASASGPGELRAGSGETDIFIAPGFSFRVVDALITNFHLPRSTLLML